MPLILEKKPDIGKDMQGSEDSLEESGRCHSVFRTSGGPSGEEATLNKSDHVPCVKEFTFSLEDDEEWWKKYTQENNINRPVF